jgi:hypothetical protein
MGNFNLGEEPQDGRYKFINCIHRSTDLVSKIINRCKCSGGDYTDRGFYCNKKNIFKVTPEICEYCTEFNNK